MNQKHMARISFATRQTFRGKRWGRAHCDESTFLGKYVNKGGPRPKRRLGCPLPLIIFRSPSTCTRQPGALGRSQNHGLPKLTGHLRNNFLWRGDLKAFCSCPLQSRSFLLTGNHEAEQLKAQCLQDTSKRTEVLFS